MTQTGWIPPDTFADRLLRVRKAKKLTVDAAAALTGTSPATWSTWERGARPRDLLDVVQRVSDSLGCDREWLLWGTEVLPAGPTRSRRSTDHRNDATTSGLSGRSQHSRTLCEGFALAA